MRCTLVCDCGQSIRLNTENRREECPDCHASYAVTVTQIRSPLESV